MRRPARIAADACGRLSSLAGTASGPIREKPPSSGAKGPLSSARHPPQRRGIRGCLRYSPHACSRAGLYESARPGGLRRRQPCPLPVSGLTRAQGTAFPAGPLSPLFLPCTTLPLDIRCLPPSRTLPWTAPAACPALLQPISTCSHLPGLLHSGTSAPPLPKLKVVRSTSIFPAILAPLRKEKSFCEKKREHWSIPLFFA